MKKIVFMASKLVLRALGWEWFLITLFKTALMILQSYLSDVVMSNKAKMFTQGIHTLASTLGVTWAAETDKPVDDEVIQDIIDTAENVGIAHNFQMHVISPIK